MTEVKHLTMKELEEGLEQIRQSPMDEGILESIVRRPQKCEREVLEKGELDLTQGLIGDNWKTRGSSKTEDGSAHPDAQLTIMNSRSIALIAQSKERWALAGDQLFIDLNLSDANLPAQTRLAIGSAIIEITTEPHNGCKKFTQRFGKDSMIFVNSSTGKELHLRGIKARVIQPGTIKTGDIVKKISKEK